MSVMKIRYGILILSRILLVVSFMVCLFMAVYLICVPQKPGWKIIVGIGAFSVFLILMVFNRFRRSHWPVPGIDYL